MVINDALKAVRAFTRKNYRKFAHTVQTSKHKCSEFKLCQ